MQSRQKKRHWHTRSHNHNLNVPLETFRVLGLRTGWFKYDERWMFLLMDEEGRLVAGVGDRAAGAGPEGLLDHENMVAVGWYFVVGGGRWFCW